MQDLNSKAEPNFIPGSVGIARPFGVPVRLHFTFILLFVFLIFVGIGRNQSGLANLLYITALFGSVLLHELGHAVVAKRYRIRTLEIVMFPIGGLARLERNPSAREELWIAIAGPLVNLVIAGVLLGFLVWRGALVGVERMMEPNDFSVLQRIAVGNLLLAGFNLLPAFPMDGGRILRALLARFRPEQEATRIAAKAGQGLAIVMGLYGLLSMNFMLIFIAFFVYLGAAQEYAAAVGMQLTQGMPVRAAMVTDYRTLSHGNTVRDAANLLLATTQQDFPVLHGDRVIGLLGRNALLRGMATEGPDAYVSGVMDREFVRLDPNADLADAMPQITRAGHCALVMQGENLLGLLTAENLSEFLILRRIGLKPEQEIARRAG